MLNATVYHIDPTTGTVVGAFLAEVDDDGHVLRTTCPRLLGTDGIPRRAGLHFCIVRDGGQGYRDLDLPCSCRWLPVYAVRITLKNGVVKQFVPPLDSGQEAADRWRMIFARCADVAEAVVVQLHEPPEGPASKPSPVQTSP